MKKLLIFFILFLSLSVNADEFQEAYSSGANVLVYFYSPSCVSCKKFDPVYDEIKKANKDFKCVRVNVDTSNGEKLFRKYHGMYVPYLVITNSQSNKTVSVPLSCSMNDMCLERVKKNLKK